MMNLPNQLSFLRIILTPVFILLLFADNDLLRIGSFVVFTIAALTDWYDGYTARKYGDISTFGKFLDPLADKILILSAFVCFSLLGYIHFWMVLVIIVRDVIVTTLRIYATLKGKPIVTNMFAKIKTVGQFIVIYLIFLIYLVLKANLTGGIFSAFHFIFEQNIILVLMIIITAVTVLSGILYLIENRNHYR